MPKISIVLPTYNQCSLLRRALESVVQQDTDEWELIIINNYSTDNTIKVIEEFDDERISYYNFQNEGVIAASRNLGILKSRSDLIAFLDSDDYWSKRKLSECINYFEKTNCDVVCHGEYWKDNCGNIKRTVFYGPQKASSAKSLIFNKNCLSTSAVVVRKLALQKVGYFDTNPDYKMVEDYDLWIRLAQSGAKIEFINALLGVYTIHNSTSNQSLLEQMNAEIGLLSKYFKFYKNKGISFYHLRCMKRILRLLISFGLRRIKN